MTIKTIEQADYKVFTIEDHPNKEAVFEWIRNESGWDQADHQADHIAGEAVDSIKGFADHFGWRVDYCIGTTPDQRQHVTFDLCGCDEAELYGVALYRTDLWKNIKSLLNQEGSCPFTGMYYDEIILDAFRKKKNTDTLEDMVNNIEYEILMAVHNEAEYLHSDEALLESCQANEYYFQEDGSIE